MGLPYDSSHTFIEKGLSLTKIVLKDQNNTFKFTTEIKDRCRQISLSILTNSSKIIPIVF